ncbi:MAG: polysaccharide biosynthesis C-terminal domain-containing protein [Lachnospiraceae bacterium]|nr:polysaccharide biosynthesis C-terminal domain-containing protein [Lachnospiraceae bacterium]
MAEKQKLAGNFMMFTAYQFFILLVPLISMPYVARVLSEESNGTYSFLESTVMYFTLAASCGSAVYGQREIAYLDNKSDRTRVFTEIFLIRLIMTLISYAVFFFVFGLDAKDGPLFLLFSFNILTVIFDISWFYQGMEEFTRVVVQCTVIRLVALICIFLFVKQPDDLPIYILCQSVPNLVGALSLWPGVHRKMTKITFKNLQFKKHLLPIFLLFLPQISSEIFGMLDKTMIEVLTHQKELNAYYQYAQKLIKIILIGITSLGIVMIPSMSAAFARKAYDEIRKRMEDIFRFAFFLGCPLMFGLLSVADVFIPLFFGDKYIPSIELACFLAPTVILVSCSNVLGVQYLLPSRQQGAFTLSLVLGIIVNIVGNALLVPHYQALGTVYATVAAEFTVTLTQSIVVRKQLPLRKMYLSGAVYLVSGAAMAAITYAVGSFIPGRALSFVIRVAIAVTTYTIAMILVRDPMFTRMIGIFKTKVLRKGR